MSTVHARVLSWQWYLACNPWGLFMTAASHSFRGKLNKDHVSTKHLLSVKAKKFLLLSCHIAACMSVKRKRRAVSSSCQPEGSFPHIPGYRCSITTGVRCSGNCSCGIMLNYNSQVQLPVLSTERAGLGCWEVWFSNIQEGRSYPISAFSCHITLVCFSGTVTVANFIVVLWVYRCCLLVIPHRPSPGWSGSKLVHQVFQLYTNHFWNQMHPSCCRFSSSLSFHLS